MGFLYPKDGKEKTEIEYEKGLMGEKSSYIAWLPIIIINE